MILPKNNNTNTIDNNHIIILCVVLVVIWTIVSLFIATSIGTVLNWTTTTTCTTSNSRKQENTMSFINQVQVQPYERGNIPYISYYLPQGSSIVYFGQIYNFLTKRPWDLLKEWHELYGPIVAFDLLGNPFVSIANSPTLIKSILQSQIRHVKKDITNTMKPFLSILGTGIVSSEGQHWFKQRLKMSHPLRFDVLSRIPYQTLVALQRLMNTWDDAAAGTTKHSVPLGSALRHLTLQVISGTFLSLTATESDMTFAKLYLPIVDESNLRVWHPYRSYLFILPSWWQYHYNTYSLNKYVCSLISQRWLVRRQEQKLQTTIQREQDILDQILLDIETKEPDIVSSMDKLPYDYVRQIRDELKTFMLAGHETSAAMMTWAIYELLLLQYKHDKEIREQQQLVPDTSSSSSSSSSLSYIVQEMLQESNSVFDPSIDWKNATKDDIPSIDALNTLTLSEACLKESLRKFCVVPTVTRRTVHDMTITVPDDDDDNNDNDNDNDVDNDDNNINYNDRQQHQQQQQVSQRVRKQHLKKGPSTPARTYFIRANTTILINIQACHWNPKYWPNPALYNPYRFLSSSSSSSTNNEKEDNTTTTTKGTYRNDGSIIKPYSFLPFIIGPRNCLGQNLALLESKMVVSLLWQRYQIQFDTPVEWLTCIEPRHRFTVPVIPYKDIMIRVTKRPAPC